MILFWFFYYLVLFFICYLFTKINKNKFVNFFFVPIILGIFGSVWFSYPGESEISPIISLIFLESTILESNGFNRLYRPMLGFIFLFEIISLIYYLYSKRNNL